MKTSRNPDPLVAVILVAYGGRDDTIACLVSLAKSDYSNCKIILVDNVSPDNTTQLVSVEYPDVEIIKSKTNLGFAGGNNLGIDYAISINAEYIFLLNNDTEIASSAIGNLVGSALKIDKLGAIGPLIYYHEKKSLIWSAGGKINFRCSNLYHRGIREIDKKQFDSLEEVDYLTGCALMFPSELVSTVGKLDESFWMYYEDADFCQRLKKAGYVIMFEPSAKVWHKISSSTGGNLSRKKMWFKFRSGMMFFKRYSPSVFWVITYPVSQLGALIRAIFSKGL